MEIWKFIWWKIKSYWKVLEIKSEWKLKNFSSYEKWNLAMIIEDTSVMPAEGDIYVESFDIDKFDSKIDEKEIDGSCCGNKKQFYCLLKLLLGNVWIELACHASGQNHLCWTTNQIL